MAGPRPVTYLRRTASPRHPPLEFYSKHISMLWCSPAMRCVGSLRNRIKGESGRNMTILCIDAVGISGRGGGAEVTKAVVQAALDHAMISRVFVFVSDEELHKTLRPEAEVLIYSGPGRSILRRLYWWAWGSSNSAVNMGATHILFLGNAGRAKKDLRSGVLVHQSYAFYGAQELGESRRPLWVALRYRLLAWCITQSVRGTDAPIVQTEEMARRVSLAAGISQQRIKVKLPAPPEPSQPGTHRGAALRTRIRSVAPSSAMRVIYVGSSAKYKNLDRLMEAMDVLACRLPAVQLLATIPPLALSQRPNVHALGPLTRDEVSCLLEEGECFVMPSLVETVGLPLLEAMDKGLAIAAADRPYAHSVCGTAFMPFDPLSAKSIASALLHLLNETDLRHQLVGLGFKRVEEVRENRAYESMIDHVVSGK